jgi:hypothetical protein
LASGPISPFYSGLIFSTARLLPNSFSFAYLLSVGLTVQDVSLARFAQLIALVLFEVPAGVVADRLGSRAAIAAATFSSLAWLTCMSVVSDLPTLVVAELANAASLSLFGGAFEILLRDSYFGQNPIARFAKTQSLWGAASSVVGTALATAVSRQFAWAAAASIQGVLLLLLAYGLLKNRRSVPPRTADSIVTVRALDAMRSFPLSLLVRVTLTTLAYTLILQFWQPLLILAGLPVRQQPVVAVRVPRLHDRDVRGRWLRGETTFATDPARWRDRPGHFHGLDRPRNLQRRGHCHMGAGRYLHRHRVRCPLGCAAR